jgi:hypothetical protein
MTRHEEAVEQVVSKTVYRRLRIGALQFSLGIQRSLEGGNPLPPFFNSLSKSRLLRQFHSRSIVTQFSNIRDHQDDRSTVESARYV